MSSPIPSCVVRHYNPCGSAPVYTRADWDAIYPLAVRNHWLQRVLFSPFPVPFGGMLQVDMPPQAVDHAFFFPYVFSVAFPAEHLIVTPSTGSHLDVSASETGIGFWIVHCDTLRPLFGLLL
jgi:hypothetical protein